ncbi:MAG: cobyrinate a,c-diamide synthase [Desulfobacteraceae bacterium]|jgi:cobyrinic acid a,c-diamide synthase|nr:cobyrinate a,c-diamide synthase [Desulfobacteraceae bacterium]
MKTFNGCGGFVIAGTGSGVGKTSVALGLVRAIKHRGIMVHPFKVGPDFLDPSYLTAAAGQSCYNLDPWMCGETYVKSMYSDQMQSGGIAIVEGAMGLFDGASAVSSEGSAAHVASLLGLPVLLIVNAHGTARSLCATVKGFATFEDNIQVAGVIANHVGSANHARILGEALNSSGLPPLLGSILRNSLPELKSRHLGLVNAGEENQVDGLIDELADVVEPCLEMERILCAQMPAAQKEQISVSQKPYSYVHAKNVRIGIAQDKAFCFVYPDNLERLAAAGIAWVPFSPCRDKELPGNLDALYFPGGYPELHAKEISANAAMRDAVSGFAASGRLIYAECGGLMYLSQGVVDQNGNRYPMAGVLPVETRMNKRLHRLGYAVVTLTESCCWGEPGVRIRGHEFHYSDIVDPAFLNQNWQRCYRVEKRRAIEAEGFLNNHKNILASYVHLHWASRPEAIRAFTQNIYAASRGRKRKG